MSGEARSGPVFLALVKNTYRVLLTRGLLGCYVYFQDDETADFVRSRIDRVVRTSSSGCDASSAAERDKPAHRRTDT